MSFGGGSSSANREIINLQREQAADQEAREAERQARLERGRNMISAIFEGGTVGPYEDADATSYEGIGQDFYDSYRHSLDDFYYPELERQYGEAQSRNLFDLARKGLLRSSEAADRAGELAQGYAENRAQIGSQIEGQVTDLKDSVNRSRRNAMNLLTSTEDPTSAANQALTEVNAVRTRQPQFNALGNLFADVLNTFGIAQQTARQREYLDRIPTRGTYESSGSYYG